MAYFDRYDILDAYLALEMDYNEGGILQNRPSCQRRRMSVGYQVEVKIRYKPCILFNGWESLSENGKEIYWNAAKKFGYVEEY